MKSIAKLINFKNILLITISFIFINSYENKVEGEMLKKSSIDEIDFENALNKNSVQFHEYENAGSLFDDFFGLEDPLTEASSNRNYQDLSLQIDSKNLRKIYNDKLLEMTKKSNKKVEEKYTWSFFDKRI